MRFAVLLLLVLLLPMAAAQSATPSVSLTSAQDVIIVNREETTSFTVQASFESDNPFDARPELGGRTIRLIQTNELPEGWSVVLSPQQHAGVVAGQTVSFDVRVTLALSAEDSEVVLPLQAILVSRSGQSNPITDQIDPESASQVLSLTLKREDSRTVEFVSGAGPFIWIALGALAILVVVLVVLLGRGNKAAVALRSSISVAEVAPGRSVAIPLTVENLTSNEDTVLFHVAPVAEGWAASLPLPELALDGRRSEELHLVVTAPRSARPGESQRVGVSATSTQNPKKVAELLVDIQVGDTPERKSAGDTTPSDQR